MPGSSASLFPDALLLCALPSGVLVSVFVSYASQHPAHLDPYHTESRDQYELAEGKAEAKSQSSVNSHKEWRWMIYTGRKSFDFAIETWTSPFLAIGSQGAPIHTDRV
ncbi:hypothetical protein EG328_003302 [Venturia inaequalis]|uniref:Uncharacterized protein n=1 Tax=Venturia inaequalis TaxID=5025 RepID=A0A8H3VJN1_VENIN|nr:hypothetical protein EG328_003302 [Venturia inaequalis]